MKATIYHNPNCGTSRNTLAILQETPGVEVKVVEYLKNPPARETLKALYERAGITPRDGLRVRGTPAEDLGLTDPNVGDDDILDAMVRSEEHTSELQSLMRISYAVFCLKKKNNRPR